MGECPVFIIFGPHHEGVSSETHPLRVCLLPSLPMQVHPEVFRLSPIYVHRHVRSCSHWRVPMLRAMVPIERSSFRDHFEAPCNFTGQAQIVRLTFSPHSCVLTSHQYQVHHHHFGLDFFFIFSVTCAFASGNYNSQCPAFCLVA